MVFYCRRLLATLLFCLAAPAWAQGPYNCPDLTNKEKITLDEMTQGKDGWFFRVTRDLSSQLIVTPEVEQLFARLSKALERRGTLLVLSPVPPRAAVERKFLDENNPEQAAFSPEKAEKNYLNVTRSLARAGVMIPNLLETEPAPMDMPSDKPFFFRRDRHWTPYGSRAVAAKIGETIKSSKFYEGITPSKYETKIISESGWKPNMALEIQRLCAETIPPEPYERFETQQIVGDDANALFGDESGGNPAVLVGSSFSAVQEYNFDGFLMEATGVEVANHAISAGSQFNAITSYVSAPAFETAKPPFIIWEMPHLIDISQSALVMFRQIIPATYGACSAENALATSKITIRNGAAMHLMDVPAEKKITGTGYYLFITSPNLGLAKFTLQFEYDDGDGEWFTVDRSQHFENSGRFFVELSDEIEGNLTSLSVDGLPNINADMEVRLCKSPDLNAQSASLK